MNLALRDKKYRALEALCDYPQEDFVVRTPVPKKFEGERSYLFIAINEKEDPKLFDILISSIEAQREEPTLNDFIFDELVYNF